MKNVNKYIIYKYRLPVCALGMIFFTFCFSSCNKWLDVKPKTQIKEDDLFSNAQGFRDALTGIYTQMTSGSLYGRDLTFGFMDVLGQRYSIDHQNIFYQASLYNYEDAGVQSTINGIWDNMYNDIANINNLLAHIDGKKDLFDERDYKLVKGEALGLRAFLHFDLLRMFGPAYLSQPEQPSIPYVTQFSKKVTPLSTVSEILNSVIADLQEAENLLGVYQEIDDFTVNGYNPPENDLLGYRQNHFNYWAAKAELARVYLYKGDKQNAIQKALEVINSEKFSFADKVKVSAPSGYQDHTFIPGQIFALADYNLSSIVGSYFKGKQNYNYGLTLSDAERDHLFEISSGGSTDYRYVYLWSLDGPTRYPNKFWQEDDVLDQYKNLMPLIRLPEMYYIAAECSSDPATAVGYLNTVRSNRGIQALPDNLGEQQLQEEILKAYQKEFYGEGQLFFFYKRLNMSHIDRSGVTASDDVYVFPLPDNETQFGKR